MVGKSGSFHGAKAQYIEDEHQCSREGPMKEPSPSSNWTGGTVRRRYGSHVAFCMARLAYFLARRGPRRAAFPMEGHKRGRITSLQERLHKAHSSEVRSMSFAEAPRCKRTISIRTVFKRPKQEASPGPNLAAARRERLD
jgi:hypothetical protein